MNEALQFIPKEKEIEFGGGDDGGFNPTIHELTVSVLDNGYVLTVVLAEFTDVDIEGEPISDIICEVYKDNDTLLKRISEILKA